MSDWSVYTVSPDGYLHSAAFAEVAESIHHSLLRLGHNSELRRSRPSPRRRPIVLGSNLLPTELRRDAVLYNLEQIVPDSPWMNPAFLRLLQTHVVWDYSPRNIEALASLGVKATLVPVGYDPVLTRIERVPEDIDLLFYGSITERRKPLLRRLARRFRLRAVFGVYGEARDRLIARSKIVLNLHSVDDGRFAIVRAAYLLANQRTIVSERGSDAELEKPFEKGIAFVKSSELVDRCAALLADSAERDRIALAGFEAICARPMTESLDRALRV